MCEDSAACVVQKRRKGGSTSSKGLSDADKELLATNKEDRQRMHEEILELRQRTVSDAWGLTTVNCKNASEPIQNIGQHASNWSLQ